MTDVQHLSSKLGFEVLYVDDDIIVVDKPAELLSVPGRGEDKYDSVYSRVLAEFKSARVVHRLDMATSGVMVLALHLSAQRALNRQFADRKTKKCYIADVYGDASDISLEINLPLRCDIDNRPRQIVDHELGKPSLTKIRVVSTDGRTTRLALTPITGRSHQLRVHLQAVGFPIVGDRLYSEKGKDEKRMHLHAELLSIEHPQCAQTQNGHSDMTFISACPF